MALSSGNVGKYEFLTGENVLSEKDLLENAATVKRLKKSNSELKEQTDIAKKKCQGLEKVYEKINKQIENINRQI